MKGAVALASFLKSSESKGWPNLILAVGEDIYLKEKLLKAVRTAHQMDGGQAGPDTEQQFSLKEVNIHEVLDAASTLPMFATQKLIVVHDAEKLNSAEQHFLLEYMDKANDSARLLFFFAKLNSITKLAKKAIKLGIAIELESPSRRPQFEKFLVELSRRHGVEIDRQAIEFLLENVGKDLKRLENEVEKIALFIGGKGRINVDVASQLVCGASMHSIFELTDAVGQRQSADALKIVQKMSAAGEPILMIFHMLARHFRLLNRFRAGSDARLGRDKIMEATGLRHPFIYDKLSRQVRRFGKEELSEAMDLIFKADGELKGHPAPSTFLLEKLIFDLCKQKRENSKYKDAAVR